MTTLDKLRASLFRAHDQLGLAVCPKVRQRLRTAIRTLEAQIVREKRLNMVTQQGETR